MKQKKFLPYILLFPTVLFVTVFTVWPTFLSLYKSFFKQRLNIAKFREPTFTGLQNYTELFRIRNLSMY